MAESGQAAHRPSGAPDPLIGRSINDRFKITALIARGGMGKVYRAEQAPLGRVCALKILNPGYSGEHDPEFHKRFFLEASIASKLTHPNTVTIFDYGKTDDDIYYMAMEYLDGVTLHRAIREAGSFPEERVAHVARQICRALREAHSFGVIHRDLKPANIFLVVHGDETDFVKVLDFGLVKNVTETKNEEQLTQTGLFMGSPKYMAPEQIRGERVDARTDIYSLGIIMYEMLTGRVPFDRPTSLNILMAQVNDQAPPIKMMNPTSNVSPAMEQLVVRCLSKEADGRHASMDELLADLKRLGGPGVAATGEFRLGGGASGPHAQVGGSGAVGLRSSSAAASGSNPPSATPPPVFGPPSAGPASSQQVPLPLVHRLIASVPEDPVVEIVEEPRSRGKLFAGLVAAFAVAALGTAMVMRFLAPPAVSSAQPGSPASAPAAPSGAMTGDPTASSILPAPPALPATAKVHIASDPAGAVVKEDNKEICASTPCDHDFDADPTKEHKLVLTRPGFRAEARSIHAGDAPGVIRLTPLGGGGRPPQPTPPKDNGSPTPSGFKDIPY